MKRIFNGVFALVTASAIVVGCAEQGINSDPYNLTPEESAAIDAAGFSTDGAYRGDNGTLWIENDINLTVDQLRQMNPGGIVNEQYGTDNLVEVGAGNRVISVFLDVGSDDGGGGGGNGNGGGRGKPKTSGSATFPDVYGAALDEAISRFNSQNLEISFVRATSSSGADIVVSRLGKRDERRGVLGSAGFPTNSGDPYGSIKMSGVLQSTYGLTTNGIATILGHEMGHCIGFRHTDYFDRSISCGGSTSNEGDGGVGANHIPGTTTGADLQGNGSWMLSCTDGSDRPFTTDDRDALSCLYGGVDPCAGYAGGVNLN